MNNSWARKTAQTSVIAAGAVLVAGAGTAQAYGPDVETSDQVGAVSGNQVVAPIQAPINICGVAAAVLGTANAGCEGGAAAFFDGPGGDLTTQNNTGLANGNQAYAPIQVPTEVSGIAAAVGGLADAWSTGGSTAVVPESGRHAESADVTTQRNVGLLSGNQLLAPIQAPIDVCGNAVAVGGVAGAGCEGGSEAEYNGPGGDLTSQDNVGLGNGNQLFAPIQAPVNVCGNAIAILGSAFASCEGGSEATDEPDDHHHGHKAYTESADIEAADVDVAEEQLPVGGVPALDTVTGLTDGLPTSGLTDGLPVADGLTGGLGSNVTPEDVAATATDTVAGVTELAGAGLL
ncbi:chaplin family protein [Glycomyces arizonensis]|uniref:chaplin family protein n=1 Tax=Glycomyces arizonensis TaxID=256035 RepID=UPI00041F81C8|nr:chaplin family protein [Glycomyces arizonensis]